MKLIVIGSSSSGNSYILENSNEALLIECGVRFDKIKRAINFKLSKIVACLISHEHKDHCVSVKDVAAAGIKIYSAEGTLKAMGMTSHHRANAIVKGKQFQVGGFKIIPFDVQHDCADPIGFLINHEETGNVLFLTDSYYVRHTFKDLNNIIVEANYSQEILDERMRKGDNPEFLRNRVLQSHMSLKTCKELLQANDLKKVNNIVLIHLSESNSDAMKFKREVEGVTGKTVYIAAPGLVINNFHISPF